MGTTFFIFFLLLHLLFISVFSASFTEFIFPNFTASNLKFIDSSDGAFLFSSTNIFKAGMFSPGGDSSSNFYFSVIHIPSSITIWTSNRDSPISSSGNMILTQQGITVIETGKSQLPVWSTPVLSSPVYALRLTDSGNLILLDRFNVSLWESFKFPTDTIVSGQILPLGISLTGSFSRYNYSAGDYRFLVGESDAVMKWREQSYWKLRMDTKAFVDSNFPVEYLNITSSGLALMGRNGTEMVIRVALPQSSDFRVAKIDSSGKFIVLRFSGKKLVTDFSCPVDSCKIPFVCGKLGLCHLDNGSENQSCSCPDELRSDTDKKTCVPVSQFLSLPVSCDASNNNVSYLHLGSGVSYFSTQFTDPVEHGFELSDCYDLCSKNCSCLGVFYDNTSRSCYLVKDSFGSLSLNSPANQDLLGYVKLNMKKLSQGQGQNKKRESGFPLIALVLLPCSGFFLIIALGFLWWRRCAVLRYSSIREKQVTRLGSFGSGDLGSFHIPGLPKKFEFEELQQATENFKLQIGSGGFGAVYKGTLQDETIVAVKKITNHGLPGRQEFCTEIAVIGNIRHTNLVKLRGFCARGRQLLLVYEYMNHGSLEKTLFGNGPVLEWQERFDIALGTARGLAYLHSGCDQKIIHCDVKPENILLHDHFQPKISDFGLSKLLSQEESSLFTTMRGTRGYLAPEWLTNAAISEKADVYSYGMVLLELISGRKNCSFKSRSNSVEENRQELNSSSTSSTGLVYFPLYALDMHEQGRYTELADPRLEGRVTSEEIGKLVRIALCCVQEEPSLRPTMAAVVGMFEGSIPLGNPRMEALNFLRFYGLRFAESSMVEGQNGDSQNMGFQRESSNSGGSRYSASYVASHEVSGPR